MGGHYPSPEWFGNAPQRHHAAADLVVEHRCDAGGGETLVHQQAFLADELSGWSAGAPFGEPHIVLKRTLADDAGDLLGQRTPSEVAATTSVKVAGTSAGLFGFEGLARNGIAEATGGIPPVDVDVSAAAAPFGDVDVVLRLHSDGRVVTVERGDAEAELSLEGDWAEFLQWSLGGDHLIWLITEKRIGLKGDFWLITYADGFASWPKSRPEGHWADRALSLMTHYRRCRHHPEYKPAVQQLAGLTANGKEPAGK